MFNANRRFVFIYVIITTAFLLITLRLIDLQIIKGEEYSEISYSRISAGIVDKAPRGEITDRYGNVLVSNRPTYSISFIKSDVSDEEFNEVIFKVVNILEGDGKFVDESIPFNDLCTEYVFSGENERQSWFAFAKYKKFFDDETPAADAFDILCNDIYNISEEYSLKDKRKIADVRYGADKQGLSPISPYILCEDISLDAVLKIKEVCGEYPWVIISNSFTREYHNDGFASHIIGRTGKMNEKEYSEYKEYGYGYNDSIGKQGVEKSAEKYLRGTDGIKKTSDSVEMEGIIDEIPAVPGSNIVLTIDMELQRVLEKSLADRIEKIRRSGGVGSGKDADSGAAVVIDVKTGDILACASYPTYGLEEFNSEYSRLSANPAKPLWNRAVSGTYTPGSTFKPLVAIAALESGNLKAKEKITDEGIYKFYEDYRPRCWIWSEHKTTHGSINVSKAIEQSCNYFFYEAGRRTGIDKIAEYGDKFGLGKATGTGLPEEVSGYIASPASKKKVFKNYNEQGWYGADTLQASIGQSVHSFTPVQIANYIATIANGGTRYKLNIIKSIRSGTDGRLIYSSEPVSEERIEMSKETLNVVRTGMKNVVDEGSARAIFSGYPIEIGGKTGTAQLGTRQANNALFAAYAPYDNPEIAVCVVLEHGVRGSNAAYVAKDLFDEYFGLNDEAVSAFNEMNNLG